MKVRCILGIIFLMISACALAKEKFVFTDQNGLQFNCEVLSQADRTVSIQADKSSKDVGTLMFPETVENNGTLYTVIEISKHENYKCRKVVLPPTIKRLGKSAFSGCKELEEINLPNGLISIGDFAFLSTPKLCMINVPNSVTSIGEGAFHTYDFFGFVKGHDIYFDNLPPIVTMSNCKKMGIKKEILESYYASHAQNTQPQALYVQNALSQNTSVKQPIVPSSDVDIDIPVITTHNENTFVVIFANENYQEEVKVEFAINDGEMFRNYCVKVLGIPAKNIHLRTDATRNNMIAEIGWLQNVSKAYNGTARMMIYYAGHGIPDEKNGAAYLLPADGKGNMIETAYSLQSLYKELDSMPTTGVIVFLDACFSGSKRGDGMLHAARGVAIKAKTQAPQGKVIVFSAAQGDETAYPYKEKGHGLFTYFLLKKLKETKGRVSLKELGDYILEKVSRESIVSNGKSQTPSINVSESLADKWKELSLCE